MEYKLLKYIYIYIRVCKSRSVVWTGYLAHMGIIRNLLFW